MRTDSQSATKFSRHTINIRPATKALNEFALHQSDVTRQLLLDEISAIVGDVSMMSGMQEVSSGYRFNGQRDHLLPLNAVLARVGLKKTTIYKMLKREQFPEPVKIGRAVRWRTSDISQWIADRDRGGGGTD